VPIRLPFFTSGSEIETFTRINAHCAFTLFGLLEDGTFTSIHHAEYFLAKYLFRLNCKHMAPTDGVRVFYNEIHFQEHLRNFLI